MIKAILFDFDGVLFDSRRLHFEALNEVLKREFNLELSWSEYIVKYFGIEDPKVCSLFLREQGQEVSQETIKNLVAQKIRAYKYAVAEHTHLPAIPGVLAFLEYLARHNLPVASLS